MRAALSTKTQALSPRPVTFNADGKPLADSLCIWY